LPVVVLVSSGLACDDPSNRPPPAPEPASSAGPAATASAATGPTVEATASPSATASEQAAADAPPTTSGSAPAVSGSAGAGVAKRGEIKVPASKNGIVGTGVADRILKNGARPMTRLVEQGEEPRTAMAYEFSKGSARPLAIALDTTLGLTAPGKTMPPTSVPRMTMTLGLDVAEKNGAGDWRIDAKLSDVAVTARTPVEEQIATAMRTQLAGVKGMQMGYWITPHGHVHDAKVDLPSSFPAQAQQVMQGMNQSFETMVAPLPEEPIGVGAKWQVVSRLANSGADLLQFATFTLKAREGSRMVLDVAIQQLAANDKIEVPGLAGVSATLKKFGSNGSGSTDIDTKDPAPDKGNVTVKSKMEMEIAQGGASQSMAVDTNLTVTFSRPK
jgi:hypothetical protein